MPGPVFLEGTEITLRPVEESDIEFLQRCMNDPEVWRAALGAEPMNREQGTEFYETVVSAEGDIHCLICDDDEPMGLVSLTTSQYGPGESARSRDGELAYYLAPEFHGQGHGSDAAATMIEYAFEDLNFRRVSARCGSFNDGSAALLESLGFEQEGRRREASWYRGEYHDMLWYGLLRREWRENEPGQGD